VAATGYLRTLSRWATDVEGGDQVLGRPPQAVALAAVASAAVLLAVLPLGVATLPVRVFAAVILAATGLAASLVLYRTVASPLGLFAVLWEGAQALANLHLIPYIPTSSAAEFMLQGSFLACLLTAIVVGQSLDVDEPGMDLRWLGRVLLVLGAIGMAWSLWRLSTDLGLFAVFSHPTETRLAREAKSFDNGLSGNLRGLMVPGAFFIAPKSLDALILLFAAVTWSILATERGFILIVALFLLVGWLFRTRPRLDFSQLGRFALIGLAVLLVFMGGAALLGKDRQLTTEVTKTTGHPPALPSAILGPYIYYSGPTVGFGRYVDEVPGGKVGLTAIITPLTRLSGHKENIFYEFRLIPFEINVYTYLRSWYDAFGVAGTLLGPAAYFALASWGYRRRFISPAWAFLAGVITAGMLLGFIGPFLTYIDFLAYMVAAVVVPIGLRLTARVFPGYPRVLAAIAPVRSKGAF
jgi:oligosaccharide repeat unit polymerase